jgi:cystathionine beta-lyase family protein involved in aluminum resistance
MKVGADLAMGSLIKNPGGTLAPGGGYVAGRSELMDKVSARLSAPGVGRDAGGISGDEQRLLFQGESPNFFPVCCRPVPQNVRY